MVYFSFPHKLPVNLAGENDSPAQKIETILRLIKRSQQDGEDGLIGGFGKFSVREKHQRNGRDPRTDEPMTLPPRKVVTLKCSGLLRAAINGEGD